MKYVGIIGNNSTESTNRTLMQYIARQFADQAEIVVFEIRPMPPFKASEDRTVPAEVQSLVDAIADSDGVIISTPEYDHTIPAALKSVLEWLSWSSEVMRDKPVMIVGASYGRLGTSRAQDHLRQILTSPWLRARILTSEFLLGGSQQAFDEEGNLTHETDVENLRTHFAEFKAFTEIMNEIELKEAAE
ncbi:NADPH-dependent FMN reductase [Gulosibacter molinativorax]|uniref:NAD(P)H-dependent oxidoreductase n=1 Tax=Gulosibacter molinativorax TaxID=256821 RepID=A0ABT7C5M4_9MICO|nr:NADPH-dependent FMN reductase [Gulosibacter molinativorax]MDJ1370491.1 NAD(P)H-dependent oxidoreductase [Gulosibacter molinativorax]QUY62099.1 Flavin reductase [Gulosibacter molinativorax]